MGPDIFGGVRALASFTFFTCHTWHFLPLSPLPPPSPPSFLNTVHPAHIIVLGLTFVLPLTFTCDFAQLAIGEITLHAPMHRVSCKIR